MGHVALWLFLQILGRDYVVAVVLSCTSTCSNSCACTKHSQVLEVDELRNAIEGPSINKIFESVDKDGRWDPEVYIEVSSALRVVAVVRSIIMSLKHQHS